jgi:hypothetical protein
MPQGEKLTTRAPVEGDPAQTNTFYYVGHAISGNYPSKTLLGYLTQCGGRISDCYPAKAGWNIILSDHNCKWGTTTLLTTITNMSEYTLLVTMKATEGSIEHVNYTVPLGPYAAFDFASDCHLLSGLLVKVDITDQATPPSASASFQLHVAEHEFGPSITAWLDHQTGSNGLSIGNSVVVPNSVDGDIATRPTATVPVFYVPT